MLSPGDRVGDYQIVEAIGRGGMGEVFLARRERTVEGFQKNVALKVLHVESLGSDAALLFIDEARAASHLDHPSIVRTIDFGQSGSLLFLAMEQVRGPSLSKMMTRLFETKTPADPRWIAHIGCAVAGALAHATEAKDDRGKKLDMVHRDVSPHNILLDRNGHVFLADFGIARTSVQLHRTRAGIIRGKTSYMSPEQACGGELDGRSDLFSLGIVLYELSAGKRLFKYDHDEDAFNAILELQPEALSNSVPGFPDVLSRAIARMLEKDPDLRPQTARELELEMMSVCKSLDGERRAALELAALVGTLFPEHRALEVMQGPELPPTVPRRARRTSLMPALLVPLFAALLIFVLREPADAPRLPTPRSRVCT